jgi:hypothetical protein
LLRTTSARTARDSIGQVGRVLVVPDLFAP